MTNLPDVDDGTIWFLANRHAGDGNAERRASAVVRRLVDAGTSVRLVHPVSATDATAVAADAVASGARAVVACGGDGTVHAVLQPLVGSDTALGVLATGSGDDIAATLGFPSGAVSVEADHLLRCLASSSHRVVDVGHAVTADGYAEYFVGVLSSGFDSAVNERANAMPRLGGQRYNAAILRELASFQPVPYEVTIDDTTVAGRAMLVSVGNGPRYGGGMRVCPSAVADDGLLDVTWLGAVSTLTFLRAFPSVFSGTHVRFPFVRTYRGTRITLDAPGQVAYADGEQIGPLPVQVAIRPAALRVLSC